jgi:hypothetical protein
MNTPPTATTVYPESATPANAETAQKGKTSFCIPRVAYKALLEAKASSHEICAYLTLAMFTDETGMFSTASTSAINRYTGANKAKIEKAISRLQSICLKETVKVSNGLTGKQARTTEQSNNLGNILISRTQWESENEGYPIPDAPLDRGTVRYVLPTFDEDLEKRIWFGGNLVTGVGEFNKPLKALKDAGDVAARLLLNLYAVNDMDAWGGVCPVGNTPGPYERYEPISEDKTLSGNSRLIRAKHAGGVILLQNIADDVSSYSQALIALQSCGLVYKMIMVLNRNAEKREFSTGEEYLAIPQDAEPLYELDCLSKHGYKPAGEEGLGGITARTAGDLGHPVATKDGTFNGTYAAIVREGFPAMVAGIYRLRFRVSNPKNANVRSAWASIHERNEEYKAFINSVRSRNGLPEI